jgi:hypothetical protein
MEGQTLTQIVVGIVFSYGLQWLKKASWFPLLTERSGRYLKVALSAVVAAGSALAISVAWDPAGVLTISGLTVGNLWAGLQAFLVSFLVQHISYEKLVRAAAPASAPSQASVGMGAATGLLVLALVLPSTGCALKGTPQTQSFKAATGVSAGLIQVSTHEREHWRDIAAAVPAYTEASHRSFQARWATVLEDAKAVDQTLLLWPDGGPQPAGLAPLVRQLKTDFDLAIALVPESGTKTVLMKYLAPLLELFTAVLGSGGVA